MRLTDTNAVLHLLTRFDYRAAAAGESRISHEKSQYVYRILLLNEGTLGVRFGGCEAELAAGDLLYLLPGERYRLLPRGGDFSLYSLAFSYLPEAKTAERSVSCVFLADYDPALASPILTFEDAPCLGKSGIFRHVGGGQRMAAMRATSQGAGHYAFLGRATVESLLAGMLSVSQSPSAGGAAERILSYLQSHPTADLSGDALSRIFSYHKNHINKLVRRATGKSLSATVRSIKIEYAKALLAEGMHTPAELATALGYYDYSHFYKAFKEESGGVSPANFSRA